MAARQTTGMPLVTPPSRPPARLVGRGEAARGGVVADGVVDLRAAAAAASKPRPISTPLMAWMHISAWARRPSSLRSHWTWLPRPGGTPVRDDLEDAAEGVAGVRRVADLGAHPPCSGVGVGAREVRGAGALPQGGGSPGPPDSGHDGADRDDVTRRRRSPSAPRSFRQTAPAATRAAVSRALARSRMSRRSWRSYLRPPARSAWPGRGRVTSGRLAPLASAGISGSTCIVCCSSPERQQTLRRTITWSYDLLTPAEQKLFRRLSVFVGGCTLEAVEAVCNTHEDLGVDVLQGVASLVDNSLLVRPVTDDSVPRFFMLETFREYARERLLQSVDADETARAHAAYVLVLAEEAPLALNPPEREPWLRTCDSEHDNIRAASQYLIGSRNVEWALRLGAALFRFWEQREHVTEGRETLARVLAMSGAEQPIPLRARALYGASVLADVQGDLHYCRRA